MWRAVALSLAVCVSGLILDEKRNLDDTPAFIQTAALSQRCERRAQTNNIFTRAMRRWETRKANPKLSVRQRKCAAQVFYRLQQLAYSKRAKDSLRDLCTRDYFRRAIYRHEARHLVARAVLHGHAIVTKKKKKLRRFVDRVKCEAAMYRAVQPLWRDGGKKLKHSSDLCRRMLEEWSSKLTITTAAVRSIRAHRHCQKRFWKGHMKRAEFMVDGVRAQCKGLFGRTVGRGAHKLKMRAKIKKRVAEYAVNALASHGNERFANSPQILAKDPVFREARRWLRRQTK